MEKGIRKFVLNPDNGYWGLSTEEDMSGLKKDLSTRPKPQKCYDGVQIIALNSTESCNLGCIYCSANAKRSVRMMPAEIAIRTIDQLGGLENLPEIVFHGSEPLLNMDLIKEAVLYGENLDKNSGKKVYFSMQSNLTLLTQEKIDFIKAHRIGISTSLDGRELEHNLNRPYKNGMPSYSDVRRSIDKVLDFQKGLCAVCVITKNNVASLSEIVLDFEKIGITEIQFLPAVKCGGRGEYLASNEDLSRNYIKLFEQTFQRLREGSQKVIVKAVTQYLSNFFLTTGIDACRACTPSSQHPLLAIDINGDIYPCDFFWGQKEKIIGNITKDSFKSILNNPKNPRMKDIDESDCKICDWRRLCGGGCLGDRLFSGGKPYYCKTHKTIFEYLSEKMDSLLEEGLVRKIFDIERASLALREK